MSAAFRNVLALLDDCEPAMWRVLEHAIAVAEDGRGRLTLAKTTDPGWVVRWLAPMAVLGRSAACPDIDPTTSCGHRLAHAAESVPASIPLCTVLLGLDTAAGLRKLARRGTYDVLVARAAALRCRRLRRVCQQFELAMLALPDEVAFDASPAAVAAPADALVRSAVPGHPAARPQS